MLIRLVTFTSTAQHIHRSGSPCTPCPEAARRASSMAAASARRWSSVPPPVLSSKTRRALSAPCYWPPSASAASPRPPPTPPTCQPHPVRQPVHRHRRQQLAQPRRRRRRRQHLPGRRGAVRHACSSARTPPPPRRPATATRDRTDRGVQPHPLQRRGLPQQRGPRRCCRSPARSAPRPAPTGRATRRLTPSPTRAASPGYYKNRLDKYGTDVELTATTRTGMAPADLPGVDHRPAADQHQPQRHRQPQRHGERSAAAEVTGSVTAGGFCGSRKTYQIYFDIRFDRAPTGFGTWNGGTVSAGSASTSGTNTGALRHLRHHQQPDRPVKVGAVVTSASRTRRPT